MAEKGSRWDLNIEGAFYVDEQCIACDACIVEAPKFFVMNDLEGHAYLTLQPTNDSEIEECQRALDGCPVGAIGDDG